MKIFILSICAALAAADVSHILSDDSKAEIIAQELNVGVNGEYKYSYETQNGIAAGESGTLNNAGSENAAEVVQGFFKWRSPDGVDNEIQYVADENGFHPQGSIIPTPPPIPDYILRALQYIRDHPPPQEKN